MLSRPEAVLPIRNGESGFVARDEVELATLSIRIIEEWEGKEMQRIRACAREQVSSYGAAMFHAKLDAVLIATGLTDWPPPRLSSYV